jgi:hypothetical protein
MGVQFPELAGLGAVRASIGKERSKLSKFAEYRLGWPAADRWLHDDTAR